MDLNHLYSQHQLWIMRAGDATSHLVRIRHLAAANSFANQICDYQLSIGAAASAGWLRGMSRPARPAEKATGHGV